MPARASRMRWVVDDTGSAAAEFVLVGALLTFLLLAVLQFAFALYVRNTALDAAAEGARVASLADAGPTEGIARTRAALTAALGPSYARDVAAGSSTTAGLPSVEITVTAPLPLIGPLGLPDALVVRGHAAIERTR